MPLSSLTALPLVVSPPPPSTSPVTFTAKLSWWNPATGKWVAVTTSGKPIQIRHTLNGVRCNDVTKTTNASDKVTLTRSGAQPGEHLYCATFSGDTYIKNR